MRNEESRRSDERPVRLYVASSNPGKLRDFIFAAQNFAARNDTQAPPLPWEDGSSATALARQPSADPSHTIQPPMVELGTLPGLDAIVAPPEDEPTFAGNARAKAEYYSLHAPGLLVLADDSGLEVDALGGAPGVRSARYASDQEARAGEPLPGTSPGTSLDERNNAALLRALAALPPGKRSARYRCALAVARAGQLLASSEGVVEGAILPAGRGSGGFGYDPLFLLAEAPATMAEVDLATRLRLSHRGRALRRLLQEWTAVD